MRKTRRVKAELWLERWILKDKKSLFRASEPDQYIIDLFVQVEGHVVNVRSFSFENREHETEHWNQLRRQLKLN